MLRRRSGKSTNRLNNRHSVQPDKVDPAVSRQHAQAAASYAFTRAQERKSADMGGSDARPRDENPLSRRGSTISQADPQIRRQRSVRFAGPNAIPRRQSIGTRASQNPLGIRTSTATLRPRAITIDVPVPAEYRPPSRSSSIGKASIDRGKAENFVTALAAYDEYYTREDDVASTPSSYRRVRRSKSMFSPSKIPSVVFNNGSPVNAGRSIMNPAGSIASSSQPPEYSLKAPKSMSFLRGGREYMPPKIQQDHDSAVQIARDRFLHQLEQQRLNKQPSFMFRSKARRAEKAPFRQSVRSRSSSNNSYGLPISSANQSTGLGGNTLKTKARKVSATLKSKIKKIFGRVEGEVALPDQQVTAHETHVRSYVRTPENAHGSIQDIPTPEGGRISHVPSRAPSLHAVASSQRLRSTAGSMESLHSTKSFAKENSRISSWNSTENSTMVSRHAAAERERQRLSVINENGTHVSSSNKKRETILNQDSAYPSLFPQSQRNQLAPFQITSPVDSQRVYSALMKRLDDNSPQAKLEAMRKSSKQNMINPIEVPARTSSANSLRKTTPQPKTYSPATIRRVYGSDSSESHDDAANPGPPSHRSVSGHGHEVFQNPLHPMASISTFRSIISQGETSRNTLSKPELDSQSVATPQHIANRNEPTSSPKRIIRERRSTFFPNNASAINRTTSPYRRALAETESKPMSSGQSLTVPDTTSDTRVGNVDDSKSNSGSATYTESVYSRTTSGRTPVPDSAISLPLEDDVLYFGVPVGNATVIEQSTYRPTAPTHRVTSSAGSTDWRNWMSAQVSTLNPPNQEKGVQNVAVNYTLPSMPKAYGHVRENAQISDDDTEVKTRKINKAKQPVAMLQTNKEQQKLVGILKNKSQVSLISNDEAQKIKSQTLPLPVEIPVAPPLPVLRTHVPVKLTKSRSSLKSIDTITTSHPASTPNSAIKIPSMSGRPVLQNRASTATLRSVGTPAKLIKKNRKPSNGVPTQPSPGITAAVENQFGSANHTPYSVKTDSTKFRTPRAGLENYSPRTGHEDEYGIIGSGLAGPPINVHAMGSKEMVDVFLSTRRRRIQGSEDSNAFL